MEGSDLGSLQPILLNIIILFSHMQDGQRYIHCDKCDKCVKQSKYKVYRPSLSHLLVIYSNAE